MARASFVDHARRVAKALAWLVAFVGVGTVVAIPLVLPLGMVPQSSPWFMAGVGVALVLSFGFATWLVGLKWTSHTWNQLGWRTGGSIRRGIWYGTALGAVTAALAVGLAIVASGAAVRITPEWSRWATHAPLLAAGLLFMALVEELLSRGLPLRLLADAMGPVSATLVMSVVFGVLHAWNPHADWLSTINIGLAGFQLAVAFFSSGGMALAWGVHFGWNAGLALLFDAPVSGQAFELPVLEYTPGRHAWLDGGAFGPEGGIVATVALLAGTAVILGPRWRRPREWLVA